MKKVLIIDDDVIFQKLISEELKKNGYEVASALNGEIGLEQVYAEKPDLILLDIKMPKMDGMEFLKRLQIDKSEHEKIPVLITSNLMTMDNISEGVSMGIRGYIVKSNESLDTILKEVEAILSPKKREEVK